MKQYYYVTPSNEKAGPVYPQDFGALGINADTLVYCQGLSTWTPAGQIPELAPYLQQPMAQPLQQQQPYQQPYQQQAYQQPQYQQPQQQFAQQYQQQYPQQYPQSVYEPERKSKNVPGLLGFIFSLVSITTIWIPFIHILAWILLIPAFILSIIGIFKRSKGLAIAGLAIATVAAILSFLLIGDNFYSHMY